MTNAKSAPADESARTPSGSSRPRRADAQRNRNRLLRVARDAYASADGPVALDAIARTAGVGIGTLYRHFPTREALVEAVYADQLDELTGTAADLVTRLPPEAAMREWMGQYARFVTTKRGMLDTLRAGIASGHITTSDTRARITAAIASILAAGRRAGIFRGDIEPDDVTSLALGVSVGTTAGGAAEQTGRLLDLIVDGLRARNSD